MTAGSFVNEFSDMMPYTVIVNPWDGTFDEEGRPRHASPVEFPCQIEEHVRMVRDPQGKEKASTTMLIMAGGPLSPHDIVTMPSSFKGPSHPPIINVSNVSDEAGFSHSEVYL